MAGGRGNYLAASIAAASLCWALQAPAQDSSGGGVELTFDIESELEFDDNKGLSSNSPGITTTLNNRFTFGVLSETAYSALSLQIGSNLRLEDRPSGSSDNGFDDPRLMWNYSREGADSQLLFRGSYGRRRIVDSFFADLDGNLIADDLVIDEGTLERITGLLRFEQGIEGPIGVLAELERDERDYTDTTNPELYDRTTDRALLQGSFQIAPVARGRAFLTWENYTADDPEQTDRITTGIGIGVLYDVNSRLTVDAELINETIDTTETILGVTSNSERTELVGSLLATQEMSNGVMTLGVTQTVREFSQRTELEFGREMELRTGSLGYTIGVSSSDTGDTSLVGSLDYNHELANGMISVGLRQSAFTNEDSEDVESTSITVDYVHELSSISSFDVSFGLGRAEERGIGLIVNEETTRAEIEVAYSQELTRDWDWRVGYRGRYSRENGAPSGFSNAVFATVARSFSIRP